jgi:hypothetical protein
VEVSGALNMSLFRRADVLLFLPSLHHRGKEDEETLPRDMPQTYSRQSRSLARSRLSGGQQSPVAQNGAKSPGNDNAASKRNGKRVIRLTSRSSNNRGQEIAEEESSKNADEAITADAREDEAEEETKLYQQWAEEYYEVVEQLPLELHRTFALMKELENKMQDRISFVSSHTKAYRDARVKYKSLKQQVPEQHQQHQQQDTQMEDVQQYHLASESIVHPDYGTSSDRDAEGEDDEIFHEVEAPKQSYVTPPVADDPPPSLPTPRAERQAMLASIAKASSEAIRAAEEKVGLAVTAYDWVDRHIRRLDGDLQRSESSLLLGLRAGTEASRGVRDALGISDGDNAYTRNGAATPWEDDSLISNRSTPMPASRKKGSNIANGTMIDDSSNGQLSAALMADMAVDPNEPKYCYCDQVSSGDMVACDNEDCPREWFHYECIGLTSPPKGSWYCLFCAASGRKYPGTYPPNAPCLPPGYGSTRRPEASGSHKKKKSSKKRKW